MGTEYGEAYITILILENGGSQKLKGTEYTLGRTETAMRVSGSNV